MNAKELLKSELAKKLQEHSKEELIDMITEISAAYFLARLFSATNGQTVASDLYKNVNTDTQKIKETLNEKEMKEDFRRFCVLKDAGLFTKTNKDKN